jgi:hypothetical protein
LSLPHTLFMVKAPPVQLAMPLNVFVLRHLGVLVRCICEEVDVGGAFVIDCEEKSSRWRRGCSNQIWSSADARLSHDRHEPLFYVFTMN